MNVCVEEPVKVTFENVEDLNTTDSGHAGSSQMISSRAGQQQRHLRQSKKKTAEYA